MGSIVDAEKSKEGQTPENHLGESVPQDRRREDSSQEDWERRIREYRRDLERERVEDEERKEKATKKEKSWELFRECKRFIKENGGRWRVCKEEKEMVEDEKRKKERFGKIGKKKLEMKENLIQKKLAETWSRLPEKEKVKFRNEEEKRRRLEMKTSRENLWKWRGKMSKHMEKDPEMVEKLEEKINDLEEILERVVKENKEVEKRAEAERIRREEAKGKRMRKEEALRKSQEEKRERLKVRRKLEERWEMIRRLKITIQLRKVQKRRRIFEDHPRRFRKEGETFLLRKGRSMEKWTGRGVEDGKAAHHLRGFPPLCAPIFPSEKNN